MAGLDALPLEVQFEIFSYLVQPLSSHGGFSPAPVTVKEQYRVEKLRHDRVQLMQHPYNQLAATCQQLRTAIEALCLHLMKGNYGRSKLPKLPMGDWNKVVASAKAKGVKPKLLMAHRVRYLRGVFHKCIFCGKGCTRRAVFNRFMWCDQPCDIKHFGRLMSKSEALNTHKVSEIHWQTPQLVFPDSTLQPLRMTLYNTATCASTTLLREKDVLELANYIKTNDPQGSLLKLAKKRIREKELAERAKALVKAENEFMKFAATWLSDLSTDDPSQEECTRAASFLRSMVQNQIQIVGKLSANEAAARKRIFEMLPTALSSKLRKLCKVEILHEDDQIVYRFGISRPAKTGDPKSKSLYIPILIDCDSRRQKT